MGTCHHGMVRPQVVDGGTASSMEVSCEYIEQAVADSQQGMVHQHGGWVRCLQLLTVKTYLVTTQSKNKLWTRADTLV